MNRKERRTTGLAMVKRLNTLKNSPILQEMDLKDIPKDILNELIQGCCKNGALQKRYNLQKKLFSEMAEAEIWLHNANMDLKQKLSATDKHLIAVNKT